MGVEFRSANDDLSALIRSRLPSLRESERRVAELVLQRRAGVADMSVVDVREAAGVASSTVVRACQRLGFHGFHELRMAAARAWGRRITPRKESPDPMTDALRSSARTAAEAAASVLATVSEQDFAKAVSLLAAARRVIVYGAGMSGPVSADIAYRLRASGLVIDNPTDQNAARIAASNVDPSTACLLISHTGSTLTTIDMAARCRTGGGCLVAITSYENTPLAEHATVALVGGGEDLGFHMEATASRIAHLTILDALCLAIIHVQADTAQRALQQAADITSSTTL